MNTRTIRYADPNEDILQEEVDIALTQTMEDRFKVYCEVVVANFALAGIDVMNHPIDKVIAYADE